jgi:hypothetical protein
VSAITRVGPQGHVGAVDPHPRLVVDEGALDEGGEAAGGPAAAEQHVDGIAHRGETPVEGAARLVDRAAAPQRLVRHRLHDGDQILHPVAKFEERDRSFVELGRIERSAHGAPFPASRIFCGLISGRMSRKWRSTAE